MSEHYVVEIDKDTLITHDGEFQLGFFKMDLETFLKKSIVDYQVVYWIPDVVTKRYRKLNYQKHLKANSETVTSSPSQDQSTH